MYNCLCDFRIWQNAPLHVTIGANANQTVESTFYEVVTFWIQPSDSSVQTGFPKKNRSQSKGCQQMDTAISHTLLQCRIHGIPVLSRYSTRGMRIRHKNGKHVNLRAWFYRSTDPDLEPKYQSNDNFNFSFTKIKKKLKVTKSAGPYGFDPWVLSQISPSIKLLLSIICTKSYEEGCLPSDWKNAHITPIHKKGSKAIPGNYHPVSLTSVKGKMIWEFSSIFCINNLLSYVLIFYSEIKEILITVLHYHILHKALALSLNI